MLAPCLCESFYLDGLSAMDFSIFFDQKQLPGQVIDALAQNPLDYLEQGAFIEKNRESPAPWAGGGVLLPLFYQSPLLQQGRDQGEYVFLLNKRSSSLPQGGDLCAPGGGAHPYLDAVTQKILHLGVLPGFRGLGFERAKARGNDVYEKILFYLGNALRESWEEIRLNPFNVEFLGPLPTYRLQSRRWIIFPLVGQVREKWTYQLSPEVEKIVPIPLAAFYRQESYGVYSLEIPEEMIAKGIPSPWVFPCLIAEGEGEEEILWGATFQIIRTFLKISFPFPLPPAPGQRVIHRPLLRTYLSGEPPS